MKEGIFDGPQIRKLLKDDENVQTFLLLKWSVLKKERGCFKNVVEKFQGNVKSPDWKKQVSRMVDSFQKLKCSMSLKLHFMDSHVEYFSRNLGNHNEGQDEKFHQGKWDENMMADYCWMLKRDAPHKESMKRKIGPHHFPKTSFHRIVVLPECRMSMGPIVILPNSKISETTYIMSDVILSNRYIAERHFPGTSFSRKSFSRIVI